MPELPIEATQQTVFSNAPLAYRSEDINPAAFGGQVGQAIQGAADTASQVSMKMQDSLNLDDYNRRAQQVVSGTDNLLYGDNGFLKKQGQDAQAAHADYENQVNDLVNQSLDGANPAVKRMLSDQLEKQRRLTLNTIGNHVIQQTIKSTNESHDALINSYITYISHNYNSPADINTGLDSIESAARDKAVYNGFEPDTEVGDAVIADYKRQATSKALEGAVKTAFTNNDPTQALVLLDKYKDKIEPSQADTLTDQANRLQAIQFAPTMGDQLLKKHGNNEGAALEEATKIQNHYLRGDVISTIKQTAAIQKMEYRQNLAQTVSTVSQTIDMLGSGATVNPQVIAQAQSLEKEIGRYGADPQGAAIGRRLSVAIETAQQYAGMDHMTFADQQKAVEQSQAQVQNATSLEAATASSMRAQMLTNRFSNNLSLFKNDPYTYLAARTGQAVKPFDFNQPLAPQIAERELAASSVSGIAGQPASIFNKQEASQFLTMIQGMQPSQQANFFGNLTSISDPKVRDATITQFKDYPLLQQVGYASIAKLASPDGTELAPILAEGAKLLSKYKEDGVTEKPPFVVEDSVGTLGSKKSFESALNDAVYPAFGSNLENAEKIKNGLKAVYAGLSEKNNVGTTYDEATMKKAKQLYFGGDPVDFGGAKVYAPYGMNPNDFKMSIAMDAQKKLIDMAGYSEKDAARAIGKVTLTPTNGGYLMNGVTDNGMMVPIKDKQGKAIVLVAKPIVKSDQLQLPYQDQPHLPMIQ